ncbi:MAG: hypothetical protein Kow0092_39860 [Deferrisomatales bacterium]
MAHDGREVCEECAMDRQPPAKACDPWAVKMATGVFRDQRGTPSPRCKGWKDHSTS